MTGDGDVDILAASQLDNTIAVYKNNGAGTFTKQVIDANAIGARTVIAVDLDRDGDMDPLSATVGDDRVSWYENDGAGGFLKRTIDAQAGGAYGLSAVDLDRDGDMDILTAYRDANTIAIHYQSQYHRAVLGASGGVLVIDSSMLLTTDADNSPSELLYTLTQPPVWGDLRLNGSPLVAGGTFTQSDINNALVSDLHSGSPAIADIFKFTVEDGVAGLTPSAATFAIDIPDSTTLAYYPLDEASGTTASDVANGNDGVLAGDPVWLPTDGKIAGGIEMDGVGDRIDIGTLDINGTGLTVAVWVRPRSLAGQPRFVSKAVGTGEQDHYWMVGTISSTALRFRLKTDGATSTLVTPGNQLIIDEWYHVACTYDGAQMRIYGNGNLLASLPKTGSVNVDAAVLATIGDQPAGAGSNPFVGTIDDVRIYERALSDAELSVLANPFGGAIYAAKQEPSRHESEPATPVRMRLSARPNPFNPTTIIHYELAQPTRVTLELFNVRGALVRTLVSEDQAAGHRSVAWDGRDQRGKAVSSGVYFVRMRTPLFVRATRITLVK